jgi:hypothetical protein
MLSRLGFRGIEECPPLQQVYILSPSTDSDIAVRVEGGWTCTGPSSPPMLPSSTDGWELGVDVGDGLGYQTCVLKINS